MSDVQINDEHKQNERFSEILPHGHNSHSRLVSENISAIVFVL